jgi:hypothetical protein
MDYSERRAASGFQGIAHTIALSVLVCICTLTFVPSNQLILVNFGILLVVFTVVLTVILARFWWLPKVKSNNGGCVYNGWSETWEMFSDYPPSSVFSWLIFLAAKLNLNAGASELAGKLLDLIIAKNN